MFFHFYGGFSNQKFYNFWSIFPKNFFQKFFENPKKGPKTSKNFARKWQKIFLSKIGDFFPGPEEYRTFRISLLTLMIHRQSLETFIGWGEALI